MLLPIHRQAVEPLQTLGGQFHRLGSGHDGRDDVGGKEGEGKEPADLVGGETLITGDVVDAGFVAGGKFLEPRMSLGDGGDEDTINRLDLLAISDDQPCFDTAPPQREGNSDLMMIANWAVLYRVGADKLTLVGRKMIVRMSNIMPTVSPRSMSPWPRL